MAHVAVVDFRTLANGSYKYMAGKRRGYWRVLIVKNANGHRTLCSTNVVGVHFKSRPGIDGVTPRSAYYIGDCEDYCESLAAEYNAGL